MRLITFLFLYLSLVVTLSAQKIDNMASLRDIPAEKYFRFHYENDYFAATDRNYTQGYSFEFANPLFKKNPINYLLITPKGTQVKHGLAFEHIGFTPKNLSSHEIEIGDRPYAASAMFKSFVIAKDTARKIRYTSSFNLGVMGPAAIGYEIQSGIHNAIDGVEPSGWKHQVESHLVINYELGIEKQLYQLGNWSDLRATGNAKLGTLFTNATAGLNLKIGNMNSTKNFKWHLYGQSLYSVIAFDATLQGGLIGDDSPYTISSKNINRTVSQFNSGLVINYKSLFLEYSRAWISQEFNSGTKAAWGGVHIGFMRKM